MDSTKGNVLVVDDTLANLRLLTSLLKGQGYTVRPVPDGTLALSAAFAEPPDLVLLDIRMPGLDGYEVCERLKADDRTRHIPVIFISAQTELLDKIKGFSIGAVDYITKPFEAEEVLARVETHLSIRNLQKRLEEKNEALSEALEQLKAAQNQLILREKMAALGRLVAGIAHEINTPLGAIRASIGNISNALQTSVQQLPRLFQQLSPERQADFFALLRVALDSKETLSSREARKWRRELKEYLETREIGDAESIAATLVNMGVTQDVSRFIPLLREENNSFVLQTAYNLFIQQSNSQNITTAVERASKIVFALKSYGRYDETAQKSLAHISEGVEIILTLYHNQIKRGITVIRDYADVPAVRCYPDELNQVWTNLIYNAIQAMGGSGELRISIFEKNRHIVVQVTDSGCGIPDNIRHRIFEPFFTTKPSGEGSGLGLDIVRKIIDRHQGRIEVESEPGRTMFSVFLPLAETTVGEEAAHA